MTTSITISGPQSMTTTLDRESILDLFISSQDRKPTTLSLYRRTMGLFFDWVDRTGRNISTLTRPDLIEYKHSLEMEGKSGLTITSYLTSLRLFYQWVEAEGVYPNIAKVLNLPKRTKEFRHQPLRPQQAKELLTEVEESGNLRDIAIMNLLARTGLRTIEVVRADVGDITFKGGQRVLMVRGKGRDEKDNFVILTDKTYKPIAEYLSEHCMFSDSVLKFFSEIFITAYFRIIFNHCHSRTSEVGTSGNNIINIFKNSI